MLDGALIDNFEASVAPGTFPGWTNTSPGWLVVPTTQTYKNYYLVEWRSDTKYDKMVKTAYVTEYSDDDEWQVARVPYNIPGALLYYRNQKYGNTYSLEPTETDPPSFGPKYQLLVVDMNPAPLRYGATAPYRSVLGTRAGSYDAALTLQPSEAFTLTQINASPAPITGTFAYPSKPAVTEFKDIWGYYAGFYFGSPCPSGSICYTNRAGSTVVPARDDYSTRITDYAGAPFYGLYGVDVGFVLGSGNPGDDSVQHGVNIDLVSGNSVTATLGFSHRSVDFVPSYPATVSTPDVYTVTYQVVVHNNAAVAESDVEVAFDVDPELDVVSLTSSPATGTISQTVPSWTAATLNAGATVTLTLVTTGQATETTTLETDMFAYDGQNDRGPWLFFTDLAKIRFYFLPMIFR
jgi:hypothetical protein